LKAVIVEAICVEKSTRYANNKDYTIRIYMIIDKNHASISSGYVSGFRGSPFGDHQFFPFIIDQKGRVDFGSSFNPDKDHTDYGRTNILEKKIEVGEIFNMTPRHEEMTYQIQRVIPV